MFWNDAVQVFCFILYLYNFLDNYAKLFFLFLVVYRLCFFFLFFIPLRFIPSLDHLHIWNNCICTLCLCAQSRLIKINLCSSSPKTVSHFDLNVNRATIFNPIIDPNLTKILRPRKEHSISFFPTKYITKRKSADSQTYLTDIKLNETARFCIPSHH